MTERAAIRRVGSGASRVLAPAVHELHCVDYMRRQAGGAQALGYDRLVPTAPAGDCAEAGRVSRPIPRKWSWAHPTGAYEVETKILKQPIPGGNGAGRA